MEMRGWRAPWIHPTSKFIREYLMEHGEASIMEIWRALKKLRKERALIYPRYSSFYANHIYPLLKLGLIERVRREPTPRARIPRTIVRITPGREDDPRWENPQGYLDPRRRLGGRRYRR